MMVEQHYDDEVLAAFLDEPTEAVTEDKHLSSCTLCTETLGYLRSTSKLLKRGPIWNAKPLPTHPPAESIAKLRALSAKMKEEDEIAEVRVKQLLAGPRETWAPTLREHPEWHTAGLVRRLIAATDRYNYTAPVDAVELTGCMVEVVELMDVATSLAVDAWREHAYALWCVGSLIDAITAADKADVLASKGVDLFAQARAQLMRSMVAIDLENYEEAAVLAKSASSAFAVFDNTPRMLTALMAYAGAIARSGQFRKAAAVFASIYEAPSNVSNRIRAFAFHNAGYCLRQMGELSHSEACFAQAVDLFGRLSMATAVTRSRWSLARSLMLRGNYSDALALLSALRVEFQDHGMHNDVAGICLDLAETLVALSRTHEIGDLCFEALDYFERAKLSHLTGARMCLGYLKEAAANCVLDNPAISEIRRRFDVPQRGSQLLMHFHPSFD